MEDKKFIETVQAEMSEYKSKGVTVEGDRFAIWFAVNVLGEKLNEVLENYHIGGSNDHKLDIGICDEEHSAIIIAQCKYTNAPLLTTYSTDLPQEVDNAVSRLISMPDAGNKKRKTFSEQYQKSKDKPKRLLAVGFGKVSEDAFKYAAHNNIEVYDFEKIKNRYVYNSAFEIKKPDIAELIVDGDNRIKLNIAEMGLTQWVFLIKATEIHKIVKEYTDGIFEENLRYRLESSSKSEIGKEIFDTVLSDTPAALSILNNGLTIVANNVDDTSKPNILILTNPQIVNGCQTSWAIYDAIEHLKKASYDLDELKAKVLVKLIKTTDDKFIQKVTKSTNKQNPITARDLHSRDIRQAELFNEFKKFSPPVFFDYRDGLWEVIVREKGQSTYRISGNKYRKISNYEAGQLYLALMGKPFWAKQFKKKIFDDNYYEVIFRHDKVESVRFNNEELGLTDKNVNLKSGADNFVKDVMFAYGLYQFIDCIKQLYNNKLDLYVETKTEAQQTAYDLILQRSFLTSWHYLVISVIHYIVVKHESKGAKRDDVRLKLIGDGYDNMITGKISEEFKLSDDLESAYVWDEDEPTLKYKTLIIWIEKIMRKIMSLIEEEKKTGEVTMRYFIDQRGDTFFDLKKWIDKEYAEGKKHFDEIFPLEAPTH